MVLETVEAPGAAPAPQFESATGAAAWVEAMLKAYLKRDPGDIHLDSRKAPREFDETALHVTELVDPCMRRAFFRLRAVERDYADGEDTHWAHEGELKEQWVRAVFRAEFPGRLRTQVAIPGLPPGTQGYLDLWWKDAALVMDVKSRSVNAPPPGDKERGQVAAYAAHMAARYGIVVHAVIVQIARENLSKLSCFPVEYDRATVIDATTRRAAYMATCVSSGMPPPVPPGMRPDEFPCGFKTRDGWKFCPWFSRCHSGAGKTVPIPSPPKMQDLMARHRAMAMEATRLETEAKTLRDGPIKDVVVEMTPFLDEHGDLVAGLPEWDVDLKRIAYGGHVSYDTKTAFAKNPGLEAMLDAYRKEGAGFYQYRYVKRKPPDDAPAHPA